MRFRTQLLGTRWRGPQRIELDGEMSVLANRLDERCRAGRLPEKRLIRSAAADNTAPRWWIGVVAHRHWLGPLRSGPLRVILVAIVLVGSALGSLVVAVTGYAEARGSTASAGWLISVQAGGALIGGLLYVT